MNHAQKQYALKRITEIQHAKVDEAEEKYKIERVVLNNKQRYDLIRAGKVGLRPYHEINAYHSGVDAWFDFSKHENIGGTKDIFIVVKDNIYALAVKARDQIMLGDCSEALKLIAQLEGMKI